MRPFGLRPRISAINPSRGPAAGGTSVTISGINFFDPDTGASWVIGVYFGSTPATSFTVNSDNQIVATSPPGTAGTGVNVTVVSPEGVGSVRFSYEPAPVPTVTSISPNSGHPAGGTTVTINGTNFTAGSTVVFGANPATNVAFVSPTQLTAVSPAGTGAVNVRVTTVEGTSAIAAGNQFTYVAPTPTVTSISPNSGPPEGGITVTINGTNFTAGSTVAFGANPATNVTFVSSTQLTATAPAGTGTINVRVTTVEGTSAIAAANQFTYVSLVPTVTNLNPNTGSSLGGTNVTITGTNFTGVTAVNFGGTVLSPIAAPTAPTVTSVNPNTGPGAGGTTVTITGTGFEATPGFIFISATQINAITPAGNGPVNVTVTTPHGTSAAAAGNQFTFTAPVPTVTNVDPNTGPAAGGTTVIITGTDFT